MAQPEQPLIVRQATTQQWLQSIAHTHPQWSGGITLELYRERDRLLREQTGDMGSSLICWVLLPSSSPTGSLEFYSSCETYLRPILHLPPSPSPSSQSSPSSESEPRKAEKATAYSIASVFTPPQHRRKGYARRMMQLLHEELRRSPSPSQSASSAEERAAPLLSFLYSDVGDFYSTCPDRVSGKGWEVMGTERTTGWDLSASLRSSPSTGEMEGWQMKEITLKDLPNLANEDAALLATDFLSAGTSPSAASSQTLSSNSNQHQFLVLPTPSSFLWSLTRSAYSFTARGVDTPNVWGCELSRSAPADEKHGGKAWGFVLLAMDHKEKKAKILRLRVPSSLSTTPSSASPSSPDLASAERAGAHLIHLVASLARQHRMTILEGWNVPSSVLSALEKSKAGDGGKTGKREDSESAVAWYGEELGGEQVEWRLNEGFAWC